MTADGRAYEEALGILQDALVFGIDPSLDGMQAMMEALGNPQHSFASIQVAGTNGKTSTARTIAALLHAAGFKVGLYTSPELVRYPERFEIDGAVIDDESFARVVGEASQVAEAVVSAGCAEAVTEFELLTCAALQLFAEEGVDFAVLEVGMGGRWDATSVVNPAVAVICGIGLDHIAILGDDLATIAGEKAAIIKPATAAVFGPGTLQAEVLPVLLARAAECDTVPRVVYEAKGGAGTPAKDGAPLGDGARLGSGAADMGEREAFIGQVQGSCQGAVGSEAAYDAGSAVMDTRMDARATADAQVAIAAASGLLFEVIAASVPAELTTSYSIDGIDERGLVFTVDPAHTEASTYHIMQPRYQAANIATAIAAVETALGRALEHEGIQQALDTVVFPGRFETLATTPLLIIDAAHNPQSAAVLADAVRMRFPQEKLPVLLLAVLADKDAAGIIDALAPIASRIVVTQTVSPRALAVDELAGLVEERTGVRPQTYPTPAAAVVALAEAGEDTVASGSITLAGAVKALYMDMPS